MRRKLTRHHLVAKERGGTGKDGILYLWRDKHDCWHRLFKNLTIPEVISLLHRIQKMKCKNHWIKEVQYVLRNNDHSIQLGGLSKNESLAGGAEAQTERSQSYRS